MGCASILSLAIKHTNGLAGALRAALRSDFLFVPDVFLEMVRALCGAARGDRVATGTGRNRRPRATRQLARRDHSPDSLPGRGATLVRTSEAEWPYKPGEAAPRRCRSRSV